MTKSPFFYRVFKAKFFPTGDVFDAKIKSGSYAWRSIPGARKVIAEGAKWRIGNGCRTRIYHDNWLPGEDRGRIISPRTDLPDDAVVFQLLDVNTGWWDMMRIEDVFFLLRLRK